MSVPFVDLKRIGLENLIHIKNRVDGAIEKGDYIQGSEKREFEQDFAKYCDTKNCVGVDSGTSALELSLKSLGVGCGDEVITVPNTFYATAYAIEAVGAKPVFVDIDKYRLMDTTKISRAITKNTKAILPVHLYGQMVDINELNLFDLPIIEDACQAHGSLLDNRGSGSVGDIAAFSFYPGKNLGAYGDGGAVVTDSDELAEKVRLLSNYGSTKKYHHDVLGGNHRLDNIQAAVLNAKLPHLDDWNHQRRKIANKYNTLLRDVVDIPQHRPGNNQHVYHLYVVETNDRDDLLKHLNDNGIGTGLHYPQPLHLTPAFKHLGYKKGDFPVAEKSAKRLLSLPMFPGMTNDELVEVCDRIGEYYGRKGK